MRIVPEQKIATLNARVLEASIQGRFDDARDGLAGMRDFSLSTNMTEVEKRELRCRVIEAELNIVDFEDLGPNKIAHLLRPVVASDDFTDERRKEVLLLGLSMIERRPR